MSSRGRDRSNRSRSRARSSLRYRNKGGTGRKCGEKWWWPVMMNRNRSSRRRYMRKSGINRERVEKRGLKM